MIGRVIKAMQANWHPDCFRCEICNDGLADSGFVKNAGRYVTVILDTISYVRIYTACMYLYSSAQLKDPLLFFVTGSKSSLW